MKETTILIIGLLLPLLGTMIGSAFVFMMKMKCRHVYKSRY